MGLSMMKNIVSEQIRKKNKRNFELKELLLITVLWIAAALLFVFIKINDIPERFIYQSYSLKPWVSSERIYLIVFLLSGLISIPMGLMHLYVYPRMRNSKFEHTLALRLISVIVLILFLSAVFYLFFYEGNLCSFNFSLVVTIAVYAVVVESFITVAVLLKRSVGKNYFTDFFKGTYMTPIEEERVFLFLDMVDSTPLVQQLGSYRFSRLMQDCFADLSDVVLQYDGSIYQFVGDEAVITWKVKKSFTASDCIDLYFTYTQLLEKRNEHYKMLYNVQPKFRAAINSGMVSIALVGDVKREAAYFGDTLNICSRLQKTCKERNADMIISESFFFKVKHYESYDFRIIDGLLLKGIPNIGRAYSLHKQDFFFLN
ncbi:adenylate/guanylate cyclase domain-containing protein [Flavobacterium sp. F52]|uniref:adenylate/guanylate cyclase domain-containing protein n=1 Tax=Flavobacterium sp. F52 TaxID=1202532 RepID=UPI0002730CB6|nr:adenylate/guanylate cyclase domain-containing protein [Flavobacterium sp. F52]EJG02061.1 guanylate cyclase [Flavobacterium sp. F52]